MRFRPTPLLIVLSLLFFTGSYAIFGQSPCEPPAVIFNNDSDNIFSPEQEEFLGEAMNARSRRSNRVIDDKSLTEYLERIGDRIAKHMPANTVKFKYHIVDQPDATAFIQAGGYVYVTRKLIAFVRSEDELAFVIGHEMGHGVLRHSAIDYTKIFKEVLGVDSLGGRRDVIAKYNEYLDKMYTKDVDFKKKHATKKQLEADEIGIYATIAAGYKGSEFLNFWKRFTEIEGKKGNWFSSIFGETSEAEKRFEKLLGAFEKLPEDCRDRLTHDTTGFESWKRDVVSYNGLGAKEELHGLVHRQQLKPQLQPQTHTIKFSPDGRYLLAQDDGGINVLSVEPFRFVFRIEAAEALPAGFTQDSKNIVFTNEAHRVQKWNIKERAAESINEVFVRVPCWDSRLSPDGNYLACFNRSWELRVYEVETDVIVFKKEKMYVPSWAEYFSWVFRGDEPEGEAVGLFNMQFSPDSRFLLLGRKFGSRSSKTLGIDLVEKSEIKIDKNIKELILGAFTFASNDTLIGVYGKEHEKSGTFSFPSGDRKEQFFLNGRDFSKSSKGDYLLVRPVSNAPVAVYDLNKKKFLLANKTPAMDVYGEVFAAERKTGEVGLYAVANGSVLKTLSIPDTNFGLLRSVAASDDGRWLAVSEKARGGIWNAASGERILFIRGFRGGFFDDSGKMYADFPKQKTMERSMGIMSGIDRSVVPGAKIGDNMARLHGRFLISFESDKNNKSKGKDDDEDAVTDEGALDDVASENGTLVVRDAVTGSQLWSRFFEHNRPGIRYSRDHNSLILSYFIKSKTAKEIIGKNPELKKKRKDLEDRDGDYLLQVVDPKNGDISHEVFLETGEGSFRIQEAYAAGDWIVIDDSRSRILLYSLSAERIRQRFFGYRSSMSLNRGLIVIENEPGSLTVYDVNSGEPIDNLRFTSRVAYMRFLNGEKELFVLTEDQNVFRFDLEKLGRSVTAQ